ncbi:MAG: carboxymuconolactone decarboxylase family protein [Chloroflexota bacterium]
MVEKGNAGCESIGEGLPELITYEGFRERHPALADLYDEVSLACHQKGPLDVRERRLIKLGIAIGRGSKSGVVTQAWRALEEGISAEELRHAVLVCVAAAGFPSVVSAMEWVEEAVRGFPSEAGAQAGLETAQR